MEKLTDAQAELYESLFWDLCTIYQNGQAWADNGISFRQCVESFIKKLVSSEQSNLDDNS